MPPVSEGWDHPVHKCDPGQAPKEDDAGGESNESSRADVQRPVTEEVEGYGCATGRSFTSDTVMIQARGDVGLPY
jgi:hypothetical protein